MGHSGAQVCSQLGRHHARPGARRHLRLRHLHPQLGVVGEDRAPRLRRALEPAGLERARGANFCVGRSKGSSGWSEQRLGEWGAHPLFDEGVRTSNGFREIAEGDRHLVVSEGGASVMAFMSGEVDVLRESVPRTSVGAGQRSYGKW